MQYQTEYLEVLEKLIAFDTTSYKSNLLLIDYIKEYLASSNIEMTLDFNEQKTKANLFATTGPKDKAGILLSGHTDVVPVEGQNWGTDPFSMTIQDNLVFGRGTADMKGFIACALVMFKKASKQQLQRPLHLCLSYDEEIGCVGVRSILTKLESLIIPPMFAIIGEPTMMEVATGHKGKAVFQVFCFGKEGHSALAPNFDNAIHTATQFVQSLIESQEYLANVGSQDLGFDVPYSTIHVGKIYGGKALNIVPNLCQLDYEIRNVTQDSIEQIQQHILENYSKKASIAKIHVENINQYPGLDTSCQEDAVQMVQGLLSTPSKPTKISFGTEGGLFKQQMHCPIVVCGPGTIEVAHKPNEHVSIAQLEICDVFLQKLLSTLL